jgi:hypothetical protein
VKGSPNGIRRKFSIEVAPVSGTDSIAATLAKVSANGTAPCSTTALSYTFEVEKLQNSLDGKIERHWTAKLNDKIEDEVEISLPVSAVPTPMRFRTGASTEDCQLSGPACRGTSASSSSPLDSSSSSMSSAASIRRRDELASVNDRNYGINQHTNAAAASRPDFRLDLSNVFKDSCRPSFAVYVPPEARTARVVTQQPDAAMPQQLPKETPCVHEKTYPAPTSSEVESSVAYSGTAVAIALAAANAAASAAASVANAAARKKDCPGQR